jgi:hypothetical protein
MLRYFSGTGGFLAEEKMHEVKKDPGLVCRIQGAMGKDLKVGSK